MSVAMAVAAAVLASACGGGASTPRPQAVIDTSTDGQIARYQAELRARPNDADNLEGLAAAYLQKVRENGDPTYYPKVDGLLAQAQQLRPQDPQALTLVGTLDLARHHFLEGLAVGQQAAALDPYSSNALGVVGDAQIELGRYDDAIDTFQRMVDLHPDLSSYARVSYARELTGDVSGAVQAMRAAVEAGGPVPENVAYTQVLLGNLMFAQGKLAGAESGYRAALASLPAYVPAEVGLAQVEAAHGHYREAAKQYRAAVDVNPQPEYVIALGEVLAAAGDSHGAKQAYDLATAQEKLFVANGVDVDREQALFEADHGGDLQDALAAAQRAMRDRPSIYSADALGWILYKTGDKQDALAASQQARRLGTRDSLIFFHAGTIEAGLGMRDAARADLTTALKINPYFSVLFVPQARHTLAELGGAA